MIEVLVFGSNLAGRHDRGTALYARHHYGAAPKVGSGRTGKAYAIPIADMALQPLPLERIRLHVHEFLEYARGNPDLKFLVACGTGLSGYRDDDMAPLFANAPENCVLPEEWRRT